MNPNTSVIMASATRLPGPEVIIEKRLDPFTRVKFLHASHPTWKES
jgi:hypothetical protein